jgi:hypothetical protein
MAAPAASSVAPAPLRLCCACGRSDERLKLCTACHAALFCNADCQRAAWSEHKPTCAVLARGDVAAVRAAAQPYGGMSRQIDDIVLPRGDPLLAPERAAASQLLQRCGIALRIVRLRPPMPLGCAEADNQLVTYLMAEPRSGLAGPAWQSGVGDVVMYRADGMPLTKRTCLVVARARCVLTIASGHVWLLWDWACQLMDAYGYGRPPGAVAAEHCTREAFTDFVRDNTESDLEDYEEYASELSPEERARMVAQHAPAAANIAF